MKNIIKDSLILFAITLIAGFLLALVNEKTKGPISEAKQREKSEACAKVFADAENFADMNIEPMDYDGVTINECYEAMSSKGELIGYVITATSHQGYGGDVKLVVGIDNTRTIKGVTVLESSETVGLGLEAEKVLSPQFAGKNCVKYEYTKTESNDPAMIDAISSATITTKAYLGAVNNSLTYYDEELVKGGGANE